MIMNRSVAPTPEADPSPTAKPTGRRNRMRVTDDAITTIRHMILTGELAPGDRLPPEADLAANLGLSRTSLREAVRALTVLGVIDTRQGDGSYITGLGPELLLGALGLAVDLQREEAIPDLIAVRRILEPAAAALAATRVTAVDLEQIRSYIRADLDYELVGEYIELDWEFHHAIARASGNPLLSVLLDGLAAPTVRMRVWRGQTLPGVLERTLEEHRAIADALEAHDADLAYATATVHIASVQAWVRTLKPGWSTLAAQHVHAHATARGV
jgi:GntR family transcriptional regulator, transcriptional repressor for pyruvate dehydrogenase complex